MFSLSGRYITESCYYKKDQYMNIAEALNISLNDDDGYYNFILKNQNVLSIKIEEIDMDMVNKIYDGMIKTMEITLSSVAEQTDGIVSFSKQE